ncbi:MAG: hypothetical protein EB015_00870 [Methylocystaceae bacterium]|nr:hypothetical protein [Methylocystaceae bacterium]
MIYAFERCESNADITAVYVLNTKPCPVAKLFVININFSGIIFSAAADRRRFYSRALMAT